MNQLYCRQNSCEMPSVEYVVRVDGTFSDAKAVARLHNLELVDEMIGFKGMYIMHSKASALKRRKRRAMVSIGGPGVKWFIKQEFLKRTKRSSVPTVFWDDPLYPDMWYLNRASKGRGYDMNVLEAWELGYTGRGIKITIMDDGIDYTHPDLFVTYLKLKYYHAYVQRKIPFLNLMLLKLTFIHPRNLSCYFLKSLLFFGMILRHGTRCAGQIAAQGNNSVCIVGIAHNAQIGGIRMLDGYITDRVEAETLHFRQDYIDIYSGSWGPEDSGKLYEGPGILAQSAFQQGVVTGRRGFGNIYVWASGNGGSLDDSCACDGYSSSPFTLSVSGVSESNTRPCGRLSWRDVQYITLLTANPKPFKDGNFTKNAVGRQYSQLYGYGLMDAGKMVRLGELWRGVPPHHRCTSNVIDVQKNLGGKFNHTLFLNFSGCQPKSRNSDSSNKLNKRWTSENGTPIRYLEHVQVYADIVYERRGLLQLSVISPSGTLSVLLPPRTHDEHSGNIAMLRWPVTTVQFWGENAVGTWQIRLDSIVGSEISRADPDNIKGFWRSVWIVAYGTDEFPIRLKPPTPERPPPPEWFKSFSKYVVDDRDWHKVYTCHYECAPGGCTGPAADQCLYGCKHFATESRQCVSVCPLGTTAFGALRLGTSLNNYANSNNNDNHDNNNNEQDSRDRINPETLSPLFGRIRTSSNYQLGMYDNSNSFINTNSYNQQGFKNEMVCQPCWSLCSACIRPHIEYDCTACLNQRFLVPLLTANDEAKTVLFSYTHDNNDHGNTKLINFNLPQVIGTCRTECPIGFFGNKSSSICEANFFNSTCTKSCPEGWYSGEQIQSPFYANIVQNEMLPPKQPIQICEACSPGCQKCINFSVCVMCLPDLELHNGTCKLPSDDNNKTLTNSQISNRKSPNQCGSESCSTCYDGVDKTCLQCSPNYHLLEITLFSNLQNFNLFSGNPNNLTPSWSPILLSSSPTSSLLPPLLSSSSISRLDETGNTNNSTVISSTKAGLTALNATTDSVIPNSFNNTTTKTVNTDSLVLKIPNLFSKIMRNRLALTTRRFVHNNNNTNNNEHNSNSIVNIPQPKFICVHTCPNGYYRKSMLINGNEVTMCSKCPPSCSTCTDITHCNLCQPGFYLHNKTNYCLMRTTCRLSEYFDEDQDVCRPCDSTCRTCSGPNPFQCTSCFRKPPAPRCLLTNQRVSKLHRTSKDLAPWTDYSNVEPNSGQCLPCCPYRLALTSRDPRQCMFCVADKPICLSGDEIGAGESGYIIDVDNNDQSLLEMFSKQPYRLILLIGCIIFIILLIIFIVAHFITARRRRHRGNNQMYSCCCKQHYHESNKRTKEIVTSVTKKRKARQMASLTNHHNYYHDQYFNNPTILERNKVEDSESEGEDDDDDPQAEQTSLKCKRIKDNNINIGYIDKKINDIELTEDCITTVSNGGSNHFYVPSYKSSNCSNGKLHSGRVYRLSIDDLVDTPPTSITATTTPTCTLNTANTHNHVRYSQLSSTVLPNDDGDDIDNDGNSNNDTDPDTNSNSVTESCAVEEDSS
ncbi:proprotein convertase subtilisin/kexin type 6 [Schistosoma bovis]|uniref:Proprotein convertase subtilisin/kexin type 6 n=1 Tax=Schistosoma bovis TaxID=6184 RepID=A0A430QAS9_SCHBO|nr:proprotein convertase subtilisin/kexin type 6 [Schistosoma bovis]